MKFKFKETDLSSCFPSSRKYNIEIAADDITSQKVPIFDDGPAEAACEWRQNFEDLAEVKNFDAQQKFTNARLLLTGDAKDKWRNAEAVHLAGQNPTDAHFQNTMNTFMAKFANNQDTENLREMLQNIRKPSDMSLEKFVSRWKKLNRYLQYLPGPMGNSLDEATMFLVFKKSVPKWKSEFTRSNQAATITDVTGLVSYYGDLETEELAAERHTNRRGGCRQDGNR